MARDKNALLLLLGFALLSLAALLFHPQPPPESAHAPIALSQLGGIVRVDGAALIDINAASEPLLASLPGIGPALAGRIVQYRADHGPFADLGDLAQVPGIGAKRIDALRPLATAGP